MDDQRLDSLLDEMFEQEEQVDMKLVYTAKNKARSRQQAKEHKRTWYPFMLVVLMNMLLVLIEVGMLLLVSDTFKQISTIIVIGFGLMQLPILAYLVGQIYYKEKQEK